MKIYNVLLTLILSILISNSYAAYIQAEDLVKTFYMQPTYSRFESITSSSFDGNNRMESWQLKALQVFSTMAIYKNKNYPKEIIYNFAKYSPREKELLINALHGSGNTQSIDIIKKKYHYASRVTSNNSTKDIINLQINDNSDNLDQAWTAFFATGDNLFLSKILEYISSNKSLLISAAEMLNREALCNVTKSMGNPDPSLCSKDAMNDILQNIRISYPNNAKKMLYKLTVIYSGLLSVEENSRDNSNIAEAIKKIIDKNPRLNYVKTINDAVH